MANQPPRTFRDVAGDEWTIAVDVAVLRRIKHLLGFDLCKLASTESPIPDVVTLVDAIYVAVKPQADAAGISDEDFGRRFSGQVLKDAQNALVLALADFLPPERSRVLKEALDYVNRIEAQAAPMMIGRLVQAKDELVQ